MDFDITKIAIFSAIDAQIAFTNFGFEKACANPKTVTAALYLYFKGVSLRKVCDHLLQFYGIKPSHATIIN